MNRTGNLQGALPGLPGPPGPGSAGQPGNKPLVPLADGCAEVPSTPKSTSAGSEPLLSPTEAGLSQSEHASDADMPPIPELKEMARELIVDISESDLMNGFANQLDRDLQNVDRIKGAPKANYKAVRNLQQNYTLCRKVWDVVKGNA